MKYLMIYLITFVLASCALHDRSRDIASSSLNNSEEQIARNMADKIKKETADELRKYRPKPKPSRKLTTYRERKLEHLKSIVSSKYPSQDIAEDLVEIKLLEGVEQNSTNTKLGEEIWATYGSTYICTVVTCNTCLGKDRIKRGRALCRDR